jgi:hypothetical protein
MATILRNIPPKKWFKTARPGAHRPQGAPEDGGCYPDTTQAGGGPQSPNPRPSSTPDESGILEIVASRNLETCQ